MALNIRIIPHISKYYLFRIRLIIKENAEPYFTFFLKQFWSFNPAKKVFSIFLPVNISDDDIQQLQYS